MVDRREAAASGLAVFSIALILMEYFFELGVDQFFVILVVDGIVVTALFAELLMRARESGRLGVYMLRHWYEVLALVPLAFFYFIETYTVLGASIRALRLSRALRLLLVLARTRKTLNYVVEIVKISRLGYLFAVSAAMVFAGTISAFLLEVGVADSKIRDLGDAFWWALATVTTVGYGDVVPVTPLGRVIGSILMITGIAILGVFISSLGSTLLSISKPPTSPLQEMKDFVKNKVDIIENLSEKDVNELVELIRMLHAINSSRSGR
ncbi:MAG: potassium channel family protein [Candidatus Caldarchaeum sp.]